MAKFDFDKPVASFSWYLQNGSADDKRGNRLHVGTGQNAQIYFDPKSGEFIGKLKYVDDYIDLADGAKQHFELPRTAREYKPSDFSPKFPISNVKFEVDESVKDFIHVLPRGLFFYQNEFYDAVFGDSSSARACRFLISPISSKANPPVTRMPGLGTRSTQKNFFQMTSPKSKSTMG